MKCCFVFCDLKIGVLPSAPNEATSTQAMSTITTRHQRSLDMSFTKVVRGSFAQNSLDLFSTETAGKQCVCNVVCAGACISLEKDPNLWSMVDMDSVLLQGDTLYQQITPPMRRTTIAPTEVPENIRLFGCDVHYSAGNWMGGYVNSGTEGMISLEDMLQNSESPQVSVQYGSNVVSTNLEWSLRILILSAAHKRDDGSAIGVFSRKNEYFIFDPHPRSLYGKPAQNGKSVLLKFSDIHKCIKFVESLSKDLKADVFTMTPFLIMNVQEGLKTDRKQKKENLNPTYATTVKTGTKLEINQLQSGSFSSNRIENPTPEILTMQTGQRVLPDDIYARVLQTQIAKVPEVKSDCSNTSSSPGVLEEEVFRAWQVYMEESVKPKKEAQPVQQKRTKYWREYKRKERSIQKDITSDEVIAENRAINSAQKRQSRQKISAKDTPEDSAEKRAFHAQEMNKRRQHVKNQNIR